MSLKETREELKRLAEEEDLGVTFEEYRELKEIAERLSTPLSYEEMITNPTYDQHIRRRMMECGYDEDKVTELIKSARNKVLQKQKEQEEKSENSIINEAKETWLNLKERLNNLHKSAKEDLKDVDIDGKSYDEFKEIQALKEEEEERQTKIDELLENQKNGRHR